MGFFQSIGSFFSNFFTKAVPAVENAFTSTNGIVNIIKSFLGSATAQTLEVIIETFFPGVSNVVFGALNTFFADFTIVQSSIPANGTPAEKAAAGLNAIANLTGNSKIIAWSNVASIMGHTISTATGGNSTLQQAIAVNQVIHNPNVLSVGDIPASVAQQGATNAPIQGIPNATQTS
jgi:hypothetical protein